MELKLAETWNKSALIFPVNARYAHPLKHDIVLIFNNFVANAVELYVRSHMMNFPLIRIFWIFHEV